MKPYRAYIEGFRDLKKVSRYIAGIYVLSLIIALALGSIVAGDIQDSLGHSMAAQRLKEGFDAMWYQTFSHHAKGLARSFHPAIVGIGAIFENLNQFLEGRLFHTEPIFFWLGLLYLLLWTFAAGGILARITQPDESPFMLQASRFFPRFVILAVMAGVVYFIIFHFIMGGIAQWIRHATRNTTDARVVFSYTMIKYAVVWLLVFWMNMIFDYSKILTVVKDLKMVVVAPLQALAFTFKHPIKTFGLYYLVGLTGIGLILLYWLIAPGAGQKSSIAVWGAFILGQIFVLARMFLRTLFYSSQARLYLQLQSVSKESADTEK